MREPLGFYRRDLPHWDQPGLTQMLTFRLADSLPKQVQQRLEREAAAFPEAERNARLHRLMDDFLDTGHGSCVLRHPEIAALVQQALFHFHGKRYLLLAWVVMPNHVHALVRALPGYSLADIVKTWKAWTAVRINKILGRQGQVWQREYFDRFIRDDEHLERVVNYIHFNPVKAGLVAAMKDWDWSSYRQIFDSSG
ncbi:transposase [bacterium]|nr:transposase [bacterium]